MRLIKSEQHSIKKAFLETLKEGKIYLFGGGVNDAVRGVVSKVFKGKN